MRKKACALRDEWYDKRNDYPPMDKYAWFPNYGRTCIDVIARISELVTVSALCL